MVPYAVVRLYVPLRFTAGMTVPLPASEVRYFQVVRRGQGPACLFNGEGQIARGRISGSVFEVERVETASIVSFNVRVALALPESAVAFQLVRQLSELGVQALSLFGSERSQKSKARLSEDFKTRLDKIAIESCRQSGRDRPMEIQFCTFSDLKGSSEMNRIVFDEIGESRLQKIELNQSSLIVIGCEGGWSSDERQLFEDWGFCRVHWSLPVLRVDTAAVAAVGWLLGGGALKGQKH